MQAFFLAMSENFLIEQVSWKQGSQLSLEDGFSIFTKCNMNKKIKKKHQDEIALLYLKGSYFTWY